MWNVAFWYYGDKKSTVYNPASLKPWLVKTWLPYCISLLLLFCLLYADTGFTVHIAVKEANLAPLFTPVDHSKSNDNEHFRGDSRILSEFCPYPVPEKYQLSTVIHQVRCFNYSRDFARTRLFLCIRNIFQLVPLVHRGYNWTTASRLDRENE